LHKPDNYTQAFGSSSQQKAFANEIAGFSAYMPDRSLLLGKSSMKLSFENVEKRFSDLSVVNDFSYEVEEGKLIALVGPSGCGKYTLLHMAAGLEKPSGGRILADGKGIGGPHPERTLMFQENALYPWLTLVRNVAFALELQKVDKRDALKQARAWLEKVNLSGFEDYYPHQVSGGMRQRAALARAFISHPKVLLLDEPFGAVDALTRLTLQDALLQLIQEERPTVLLVTHDVDEALFLADRILVFSPRPTRVLKEFNLQRYAKSHDLSQYSGVRREILALLGIHAVQEEFIKRNEEVVI
jgi:NitT/TauT family transport system ATP-binding protein